MSPQEGETCHCKGCPAVAGLEGHEAIVPGVDCAALSLAGLELSALCGSTLQEDLVEMAETETGEPQSLLLSS